MRELIFWNKKDTLLLPDDSTATPERIYQMFPHIRDCAVAVIEYLPNSTTHVGGVDCLDVLRGIHEIDEALTPEEALAEINYKLNNPPPPEPSADDERDAMLVDLEYRLLMLESGM